MRLNTLTPALVLAAVASSGSALAERPDHFKGLPADSLEQAVANFSEYNGRLAAIVDKDAVSPADVGEVHRLTYTLENALGRIQDELSALAGVLEEVHLASESGDVETTVARSREYLGTAAKVID